MIDVLKKIYDMRCEREWSEYRLAVEAGLAQSTISTWYTKHMMPSFASLDKICHGFGITLSQFFAEGDDPISLTAEQRDLLDRWATLDVEQKKALLKLMEQM